MKTLIVTGTDTGIGKTAVSAMLTLALNGVYWKPIQSGIADGTDRARVSALTGLPSSRLLSERYVLKEPLSPHRAAELDGVAIDPGALHLPRIDGEGPLIVEGAGGVLVPITRSFLQADLFAQWGAPAVLVARTALGTINHSLLSLEALRARAVSVLGIVFVGDAMPDTEDTICSIGRVKRLGRLPFLAKLDAAGLRASFAAGFDAQDFSHD
jgi:dethiobiotin synthetase